MLLVDGLYTVISSALSLLFTWSVIRDLFLAFLVYYFGTWLYHVYEPVPQRPSKTWSLSSKEFHGGRPIPIISPSTGQEITDVKVLSYTTDDVNECVKRAKAAQKEWAKTTFAERRAVLRDLMEAVVSNQDEICRLSSTESGKTIFEAEMGEVF